jgi:hypothetical protein
MTGMRTLGVDFAAQPLNDDRRVKGAGIKRFPQRARRPREETRLF